MFRSWEVSLPFNLLACELCYVNFGTCGRYYYSTNYYDVTCAVL
jgi:hypothetical protein